VRKFSTGEDENEENFKTKTLRFTNNNFIGGVGSKQGTEKKDRNSE